MRQLFFRRRDWIIEELENEKKEKITKIKTIIGRVTLATMIALTLAWSIWYLITSSVPAINDIHIFNKYVIPLGNISVSQWMTVMSVPLYALLFALWTDPNIGLVEFPFWYKNVFSSESYESPGWRKETGYYEIMRTVIIGCFLYSLIFGVVSGLFMLLTISLSLHIAVALGKGLVTMCGSFCSWISGN